jgi:hypothetical protein
MMNSLGSTSLSSSMPSTKAKIQALLTPITFTTLKMRAIFQRDTQKPTQNYQYKNKTIERSYKSLAICDPSVLSSSSKLMIRTFVINKEGFTRQRGTKRIFFQFWRCHAKI